ncbi:SDR family oxidoreductase [Bacillus sp. EB600]|uniref:SDR family oxidoreductase n=1 Tax=Bacillus sp. EB600 TaxID=2806345 RepID=UPI00210CAF24|nr:SDR family oxidoreductase [Bacillus sp. EB600]MCQ6281664.1 SDR family oxidoreductase [Bacillus sp. EB600]
MSGLKEKVIVITGASSGIGEATALSLAEKGAKVVLAARRKYRLKEITEKIKLNGGSAIYFETDVTSHSNVQKLSEFTIEKFGKIDVWVNNAGIMPLSFLNKLKIDEWNQMIDVNIKGVLYGIAAAIPIMEKQGNGHIINVSSVAGYSVGMTGAVYSGTKFAVRAITEGLRLELSSRSNIRTTVIYPGSVESDLNNNITDKDALNLISKNPSPNKLEGTDIANSIIYAIEQPDNVSVNEILIRPTWQKVF